MTDFTTTDEFYKRSMALSLMVNQMTESPNYMKIINAIAREFDNLDQIFKYIGTLDVRTARGVWLDLFGSIVGQGRTVDIDLTYQYFGYRDIDSNLGGYGTGAYWYFGAPDQKANVLNDTDYRRVIMAKAAKNTGDTSHISIVQVLSLIFPDSDVNSANAGNANVSISVSGTIDENMLALIKGGKILPLAAGVGLNSFLNPEPSLNFGYSNIAPDAKGYGDGKYIRNLL